MEFLTDISSLEGKTIKKAILVDCDELLVISFTDETNAIFNVNTGFDGNYEIILDDDVDDYLLRDAGIISVVQYELIKARKDKEREERFINQELAELEKLTKKWRISLPSSALSSRLVCLATFCRAL